MCAKQLSPTIICDVHLWKYCINNNDNDISKSVELLSKEEILRIKRLPSEEDRSRLARVRIFVRDILARYTHLPPQEIQFISNTYQRPLIRTRHSHPPIYFNLSHRKDYALLAISNVSHLGVDIEEIKDIEKMAPFVSDYFSPPEKKRIFAEKKRADRLSLLFTIWTMKEALFKSLATGFTRQMNRYDLSPFLRNPYTIPHFDNQNVWHIRKLAVAKNHKAAIAVRADQVNLQVFEYGKC